MNCPFCFVELCRVDSSALEDFYCDNQTCKSHKMPRFKASYTKNPFALITREFILGEFYIKQDFIATRTIISKLQVIFILDSVSIPFIIPVNLIDLHKEEERIKNLLIFS